VGGLVRDGFASANSTASRVAEAGQHGFWNSYRNIFRFLQRDLYPNDAHLRGLLTDMATQGQYSPRGLEAVWPVYQSKRPTLPTGLAQLLYTDFLRLPLQDRLSALPLALALADFDEADENSWRQYDATSFRDLCQKCGVSQRCYDEAFEPMILTGRFAPGRECSAAAALGMARFFVMQSQAAFDVRWCRGNIGERIFEPWIRQMQARGLTLELSTRVEQFEVHNDTVASVVCRRDDGSTFAIPTDHVVLAVSAKALQSIARTSSNLARSYREFRGFANLRGTSVVATRLDLDKNLTVTYSANACWGFHRDVGMTMFDIRALHGPDHPPADASIGSVVEVDYYYANSLLALSDDDLVRVVKRDLDNLLGIKCEQATVVDAAVVRLPDAVNWYFPGSYSYLPSVRSESITNLCFAGDVVKTNHRSWSQEKAFVTGIQAANVVLGRPIDQGVLPVDEDELHVQLGRAGVRAAQSAMGCRVG
jgi:uncharacterized protein with NAD-binding domain and iron-sulfur cluster